MIAGEAHKPSKDGTVVYLSVADLDKALTTVTANGGTVIVPKMSIGEYGSIAQFIDSEGNRVALHSDQ